MTRLVTAMGNDPDYQFVELYGLDPDLLAMVPQPVAAVLMCYPDHSIQRAPKDGQEAPAAPQPFVPPVGTFFVKQIPPLNNACGTIGAVHCVLNSQLRQRLAEGSALAAFAAKAEALQAAGGDINALGNLLNEDDALEAIHSAQAVAGIAEVAAAKGGDAQPSDNEDDVEFHFVAFTEQKVDGVGHVIQFDGMRGGPVDLGAVSDDGFFATAASIIQQQFMQKAVKPNGDLDLRFNMMALAKVD